MKTAIRDDRGTVLRWLKAPGDRVQKGDPLVEIETDKITTELEAPESGILRTDRVIIAVSGYEHGEDRALSRNAGCDAYLVKPADHKALSAVPEERS